MTRLQVQHRASQADSDESEVGIRFRAIVDGVQIKDWGRVLDDRDVVRTGSRANVDA